MGPLLHAKVDRIFPIAQARGSIPRASRWCSICDRQSRENRQFTGTVDQTQVRVELFAH